MDGRDESQRLQEALRAFLSRDENKELLAFVKHARICLKESGHIGITGLDSFDKDKVLHFHLSKNGKIMRGPPPREVSEFSAVIIDVRSDIQSAQAHFPRCWEWFRYLLPRNVQERVYEPLMHEMLEDYIEAHAMAKNCEERQLVKRIFWFRALYGFCHCMFSLVFSFKFLWLTRLLRTSK